jgi:DNA-binding CsgD family transcriptional regulator
MDATSGLIGRDEELAAIDGFLDEPAPAALVLQGEAGIGKTVLLRKAVERALERGFRVLEASPTGSEARLAFACLSDLLGPVFDEVADSLPPPQRHALAAALLLDEAEPSALDERAVAVAFLGALRTLSATSRVVLAVDDLQWADAPSAAVLAFAARRLGDDQIVLVLAQRTGQDDGGALPVELGRGRLGERTRLLPVGPLSLGALHRLFHQRMGCTFARPTLTRLHQTSAGNPFYALQLAGALDCSSSASTPLPVPADLRALVAERLTALPSHEHDLLLLVACAGEIDLTTLEAAGGEASLVRAFETGLVELRERYVRFTHPLLAAAAQALAAPTARRRAYERLAGVAAGPEERARYLAFASTGPSERVAAELERAASAAAARGAILAAAELATLAVDATPGDNGDGRARRTIAAAGLQYTIGDLARSAALLEPLIEELPAGHARAAAVLARMNGSDGASWIERCEQALEQAGDDALRAAMHRALSIHLVSEPERASAHARASVERAEAAGDETVLAQSLAWLIEVETTFAEPPAERIAERALELERRVEVPLDHGPSMAVGIQRLLTDRLDEAETLLTDVLGRAEEQGDECTRASLLRYLSRVFALRGDLRRALTLADEAVALQEQVGGGPDSLVVRADILAHLGELDEASASADSGVLGFIALSRGDLQQAAHHLRPLDGPGAPRTESADVIEALIGLGELDEARERIDALEQRARPAGVAWALAAAARFRALLAAEEGDEEGAAREFERAFAFHDQSGRPFERARTLLALGRVQRRARQRRGARESLTAALAVFEQLGTPLWAELARAELARISGRAPGADELTPTEQRVSELVAKGRTNVQVAAALFVTPKTIEFHLRNVFRKLDVRSRAELAWRYR